MGVIDPSDSSAPSSDPAPGHDAATIDSSIPPRGSRPSHKDPDHIGPFRILEKIGEGGMGVVYKAEQREPVRRIVALKVIKLGMDTHDVVARFEAERQALAMLSHPNVAKVFEAGVTEIGRPYFAMEYVPGVPFTQYCDDNRFTTRQRLELFMPVCEAVQHAHQKGIIHRDLKPGNILVTLLDGRPVPKVIDFGIAKATNQTLSQHTLFTQTGTLIGTPEYMSPEQAMTSGLDVDTRTDVYSLGVILYELLTGTLPLDAKSLRAAGLEGMARLIKSTEPRKPSTRLVSLSDVEDDSTETPTRNSRLVQKELRGDLDWIILKAMEKDRSRRYETASALAMDIQRHLTHQPVTARPPSTVYRFQKAWQRNRVAFTAGGLVVLALIIGTAVSTWQAVIANRAKTIAETARGLAQSETKRADAETHQASESQRQTRRFLYVADMNLAHQSVKQNNIGRARRLLDRHRPKPGEEDLRGWEWRYLWQLTRSNALLTLSHRPVRGFDISFSPDGSRLALGWIDGRVDLWDVKDRRPLRTLADPNSSYAGRVAFSPNRNLLAATSKFTAIMMCDLDAGTESTFWQAPANYYVRSLAFSKDGTKLFVYAASTTGAEDQIVLVNVATSETESQVRIPYGSSPHFAAAALSPDNRFLYVPQSDRANYRYTIQCVEVDGGKAIWQTPPERDLNVSALAISPDGRLLASASGYEDPTIRIWDASTGQLVRRLEGHTGWVSRLVFDSDGRRLISAASDQSIRMWDTNEWTETQVLRGHTDEVQAVAISESARLLGSISKDGDVMLWKTDVASAPNGYIPLSQDLKFNQMLMLDGARALLLPAGKPPVLLDLKSDAAPPPLARITSSNQVLAWFAPDTLCLWDEKRHILVCRLQGQELIQIAAIPVKSANHPTSVIYNAASRRLAWTEDSSPSSIFLTDLTAPDHRVELKSDTPGMVPFRFSAKGDRMAAITRRGTVLRIWNLQEGQKVTLSIEGLFSDATFVADGNVLAVTSEETVAGGHEVRFYDLAHPQRPPHRVPGKDYGNALALSPDGNLLASSADSGLIRLFNPATGDVVDSLHGHLNGVNGLAFSADGRRLVSADSGREAVKLWDVATRQELLTLPGVGSSLRFANWSADGDVIYAGSPWQAWRAPSWQQIAASENTGTREGK